MKFAVVLAVLSVIFSSASARRSHKFPKFNHKGVEVANEFQYMEPGNTVDHRRIFKDSVEIMEIFPTVISNDEMVTIKFSSKTPNSNDWIGAYSPPDSDVSTVVPIKYGWCDDDDSYLSTGVGSLQFNLTNVRNGISFHMFTNGTKYPVHISTSSQTVSFKNNNQPLRPRIVPSGDLDLFKLHWSSATSTKPTLRWGTESGKYTNVVSATTSNIPRSSMCGAPASTVGWFDLGLIHTADLKGMIALANQKIYYTFGDDATNDYSEEHVFFAPPLPGTQPPNRPTRAILYDDMGRGSLDMSYTWNEYGRPSIYTAMGVGAEVAAGTVDAIYHGGDISYATGYLAVWDFFMDMLSPVASGALYLTTVGNHESDWPGTASYYTGTDSGGECGVCTTRLLPMPSPATTDKPWWSYDVGLIHFIGMSTEHNYTMGSEQYVWLENDLKSVNRTITPWIIFGGHRAMYLNSNYGGAVTSDLVVMDLMIENLEELLFKYRVNIGFYGHNHVVQRQSAVYKKSVVQKSEERIDENGNVVHWHENPQATVQMVVGTAGAAFTINAVTPPPDWNELFFYEWGYTRVRAVNATYLDWEWVNSQTNEIKDRMVITQVDPNLPWQI